MEICAYRTCLEPVKQRGLCSVHFERFCGRDISIKSTVAPPAVLKCTVDHCDRPQESKRRPMCQMHRKRLEKHGSTDRPNLCQAPGCSKRKSNGEHCALHVSRLKHFGTLAVAKKEKSTCVLKDCNLLAKARGLCTSHYAQYSYQMKTRRVLSITEFIDCVNFAGIISFYTSVDASSPRVCSKADCEQPIKARGLCVSHYSRLMYEQKKGGRRYVEPKKSK